MLSKRITVVERMPSKQKKEEKGILLFDFDLFIGVFVILSVNSLFFMRVFKTVSGNLFIFKML